MDGKSQHPTIDESPLQTKSKAGGETIVLGTNTAAGVKIATTEEKAASAPQLPEQLVEQRAAQTKKSETIDLKVEKTHDLKVGQLESGKLEVAAPG